MRISMMFIVVIMSQFRINAYNVSVKFLIELYFFKYCCIFKKRFYVIDIDQYNENIKCSSARYQN